MWYTQRVCTALRRCSMVCACLTKSSVVAAIALLAQISSASALDRRIIIDNQTDVDVLEMNVSNVGARSWGPDQLGDGVLRAHRYTVWNIDDRSGYCRFDFRFLMADGGVKYKYDMNVCADLRLNVVD